MLVLVAPSASSATEVSGSTLGDSVEKTPLTLVNRLKIRRGKHIQKSRVCIFMYLAEEKEGSVIRRRR